MGTDFPSNNEGGGGTKMLKLRWPGLASVSAVGPQVSQPVLEPGVAPQHGQPHSCEKEG